MSINQQFRAIRKADGTMFGPADLRVTFNGDMWETDNGLSSKKGDSLRIATPITDRKGRLLFDGDIVSMFPDHPEFIDKPDLNVIVYAHGSHWLYELDSGRVYALFIDFRNKDMEYKGQYADYDAIQNDTQSQELPFDRE